MWGWWSHRRFEFAAERRGGRRRRDRLRGRGWGRKEPSAVSRAVPLESPNVERSLRLFQRRRRPKTTTKKPGRVTFFLFLFIYICIYSVLVASSPRTGCNLRARAEVHSCIWKEPGASARRRDAELFWRMELIAVRLF